MRTFCSTSRTEMPSARIWAMIRNTSLTINGASPWLGSSKISSLGFSSRARPIGQHLLLAAGQLPAEVLLALAQAREQLVNPVYIVRTRPLDRHAKVFVHGQVGEDAAAFRNVPDARGGDAVRRLAGDVAAEQRHPAGAWRSQADQAAQRRGLAGAIASKQCGDLALGDGQADIVQDMALAVDRCSAPRPQRVHSAFPR